MNIGPEKSCAVCDPGCPRDCLFLQTQRRAPVRTPASEKCVGEVLCKPRWTAVDV